MIKIILFLLLMPFLVAGQGNTFFVPSQYTIISNEKYQHLDKIYQKLFANLHDKREQKPLLYLVAESKNMAFYNTNHSAKAVIVIEELAYDLCKNTTNPDQALATLLGHELGHFYHNISSSLMHQRQETDLRQTELKADLFGAMLVYVSGYTQDLDIIENLYKGYQKAGIKIENPKYPTLQERTAIFDNVQKEVKMYKALFRTANYLTMLKEYETAAYAYEKVAEIFPTIEIYNNIGVCWALSTYNSSSTDYILPFEAMLTSPLASAARAGETSEFSVETRLENVQKAFNKIHGFDKFYPAKIINQTCIYLLKGENLKAKNELKTGEPMANFTDFQKIDYYLLKTILEKDKKYLEMAKKIPVSQKYPIFKHNEAFFNQNLNPTFPPKTLVRKPEILLDMPYQNQIALTPNLAFAFSESKPKQLMSLKIAKYTFQMPLENSQIATQNGIKIGDLEENVSKIYGKIKDKDFFQSAEGYFLLYSDIIFLIDANKKVLNWISYKK